MTRPVVSQSQSRTICHTRYRSESCSLSYDLSYALQYAVKFGEVTVGLALLYIILKDNKLNSSIKNKIFYLGNFTVIIMMVVAIYTHLHPDVPANILPMEYKPPVMPILYLILASINIYLNKKHTL